MLPIQAHDAGRQFVLTPNFRRALHVVPSLLFLLAFFVVPLVDNGVRSFFIKGEFSLSNYTRLADSYYLGVITNTVVLSLVVTVISLVAGYPVAYYLARHAGRWRNVLVFMLIAPLLTSIIMRTFGWQVLFARRGLLNSLMLGSGWIETPLQLLNGPFAIVIGLVHVLVPMMVLSITSVLQSINPRLEESARVLGAGWWRTFFQITFPLSLDGVGTGAIIVFMLASGSFVTLLMLGGGSMQTLPLLIYQQFTTTRDFGFASTMSNVMLLVALACLYLQLRLIKLRGVKAN